MVPQRLPNQKPLRADYALPHTQTHIYPVPYVHICIKQIEYISKYSANYVQSRVRQNLAHKPYARGYARLAR